MKKKLRKIDEADARHIYELEMPKAMSDWFDILIKHGQYVNVQDKGEIGYAMKSRNCTVIMFPNWNCDKQFKDIVNKLR